MTPQRTDDDKAWELLLQTIGTLRTEIDALKKTVAELQKLRWIIYGIGLLLAAQFGGVNLQKVLDLLKGQ